MSSINVDKYLLHALSISYHVGKFGYPFIHASYVFAFVWFQATGFLLLLLLINALLHAHIQQFDSCSCVNHVNPS